MAFQLEVGLYLFCMTLRVEIFSKNVSAHLEKSLTVLAKREEGAHSSIPDKARSLLLSSDARQINQVSDEW